MERFIRSRGRYLLLLVCFFAAALLCACDFPEPGCASDADCAVGFCDTGISVCQVATTNVCVDDAACGVNSFCDTAGSGKCTYVSLPVYIGASLGGQNYQAYLRMAIGMSVTEPYDEAPVLHSWDMTYFCSTTE